MLLIYVYTIVIKLARADVFPTLQPSSNIKNRISIVSNLQDFQRCQIAKIWRNRSAQAIAKDPPASRINIQAPIWSEFRNTNTNIVVTLSQIIQTVWRNSDNSRKIAFFKGRYNIFTYKNLKECKCPNDFGIIPVKLFLWRSKLTKFLKLPISFGIDPNSLLPNTFLQCH